MNDNVPSHAARANQWIFGKDFCHTWENHAIASLLSRFESNRKRLGYPEEENVITPVEGRVPPRMTSGMSSWLQPKIFHLKKSKAWRLQSTAGFFYLLLKMVVIYNIYWLNYGSKLKMLFCILVVLKLNIPKIINFFIFYLKLSIFEILSMSYT